VRVAGGRVDVNPEPGVKVTVTVTVLSEEGAEEVVQGVEAEESVVVESEGLVAESEELVEGNGTSAVPFAAAMPPVAPEALMRASALFSLVHASVVPRSRTEGKAKHFWVDGQAVVFQVLERHCASALSMQAV